MFRSVHLLLDVEFQRREGRSQIPYASRLRRSEQGLDQYRLCHEQSVPIYHGKIDKTLFQASLEAVGATAGASASA
ncbi:MAG: hypothetical protein ACKO0Z_11190 [Betaproteobacteria bacterium]